MTSRLTSNNLRDGVTKLPSIAFVLATVGGAFLPVLGSLSAIFLSIVVSRKAKKAQDPSARRLASLSLLIGYAGLAFWIALLTVFALITRH
jgi:hypothetical protein